MGEVASCDDTAVAVTRCVLNARLVWPPKHRFVIVSDTMTSETVSRPRTTVDFKSTPLEPLAFKARVVQLRFVFEMCESDSRKRGEVERPFPAWTLLYTAQAMPSTTTARAGSSGFAHELVTVDAPGIEAAADWDNLRSPETSAHRSPGRAVGGGEAGEERSRGSKALSG